MRGFNLFQWHSPGKYRIRYVLKGTAKDFNVTYKCGKDCSVVQKPHVTKGWSHHFTTIPGDYYYLSAQANEPGSSVEVRVYQNGKLLKELSKEGNYPLISTAGLV